MDERTFAERARRIEWLLLDVDGVLTDGRLVYTAAGEETKVFATRDGLGIRLAQADGIEVGVISGRTGGPLERRLDDLGIEERTTGRNDKGAAFDEMLARRAVAADRVAYAGDDLLDLPVLARCGLSFAPADAVAEVRETVDVVLDSPGGGGAVRELVERLLVARDAWERTVARFRG